MATEKQITKIGNDFFKTRFVAHHFATADQEFDACKFGMWMFLLTEIMLFGGLFVAWVVYRLWYPETFKHCAQIMDWKLGLVNTCILIISSLTMSLAIRAVKMSDKKTAVNMMLATVLCGAGFLIVKYFEYAHKFHLGIFPGSNFSFSGEHYSNAHIFFSLYFVMTATHVFHVIVGMTAILWCSYRASRGHFYKDYYTPVELTGMYWHLVELIWIFLFPMFSLIK